MLEFWGFSSYYILQTKKLCLYCRVGTVTIFIAVTKTALYYFFFFNISFNSAFKIDQKSYSGRVTVKCIAIANVYLNCLLECFPLGTIWPVIG